MSLPSFNSRQPPDQDTKHQSISETNDDTVIELAKVACDNENYETIRELLQKGRNETDEAERKDYYNIIGSLVDKWKHKYTDNKDIFGILMVLLSDKKYGEYYSSLMVIAATKGYENILEFITEWVDILLKYKENVDIDASDDDGKTLLHYAVQGVDEDHWTLQPIAKSLIRNGARINLKDNEGICVIDRISANTIEDILNDCIEESNGSSKEKVDRRDENYELKMDLSIFSHKENESDFIRGLNGSKSHQHLLSHPVIATFLHIKWQKARSLWYIYLLANATFYSLILYYMFYFRKVSSSFEMIDKELNIHILQTVITIFGIFLMVGEIIQMRILKLDYFKNMENYLEVAILLLTWVMLYMEKNDIEKSFAAWLVVLIASMLLLLFEKLHLLEMSLYISMFRKVAYNFVKLLIPILLMIVAFAVSFFILMNISEDNETRSKTMSNNRELGAEEMKNGTVDMWDSFLKTLIMTTGEFDFSDLKFEGFPTSSLLFAVFVFTMFLVGMNLLNGIAISDIQIIRNDASMYKVHNQVECIIIFERFRPLKKWGLIFPKCFPDKTFSLRPNRHISTTWVKCNGKHNDSQFRILAILRKVHEWFTIPITDKQTKDCYAHRYMIPNDIVVHAKQIKTELESEEQEDEREKRMKIEKFHENKQIKEELEKEQEDDIGKRLTKIEDCLKDIIKHINK